MYVCYHWKTGVAQPHCYNGVYGDSLLVESAAQHRLVNPRPAVDTDGGGGPVSRLLRGIMTLGVVVDDSD